MNEYFFDLVYEHLLPVLPHVVSLCIAAVESNETGIASVGKRGRRCSGWLRRSRHFRRRFVKQCENEMKSSRVRPKNEEWIEDSTTGGV